MPNSVVIGYHLIWTAYGTWLPNDPRGSGSATVRSFSLAELGAAHLGRRQIQPARSKVREFYTQAEPRLKHTVLRYDSQQRDIIAAGIADAIKSHTYSCYACAIMPDHVHVLIRKHKRLAEDMIDNIQSSTRLRLSADASMPEGHPIWTVGGWKVFLDSPEHVRSIVGYIERNPLKEGLPTQHWPFVSVYDDWPFHKRVGYSQRRG